MVYTGYLQEELRTGLIPEAAELLLRVDILIDGLYMESAVLLWRGSRNQEVHFLTERYRSYKPLVLKEGSREAEIQVGKEGLVDYRFF